MEALYFFVITGMILYLVFLAIFFILFPKKNPHRMISFWITLILSTIVVCVAFFLLVMYAIGGGF